MRRDWQPELLCFEKLSMSGFLFGHSSSVRACRAIEHVSCFQRPVTSNYSITAKRDTVSVVHFAAKQYIRPPPPRGAVSAQLPLSCAEFHTEYLPDGSPPGPRPSE